MNKVGFKCFEIWKKLKVSLVFHQWLQGREFSLALGSIIVLRRSNLFTSWLIQTYHLLEQLYNF